MIRSPQETADRGQSEVLGVVLLLAIVGIAAISLLLVGGQAISETEREAEHESVEQSFVELSQTMATATDNGDVSQTVEMDAGEHGAITKVDNGEIEITYGDNDPINYSIGTIEYQGDDGTKIAYEAGGVFRETGEATRVVSTPNIHYDLETETLTMPILNVNSSTDIQSGPVHIRANGTDPFNEAVVVEDKDLTINVTSEYYLGWKQFFENQAGDTVVTEFGKLEGADGNKGYVEVALGYDDLDGAFKDGVTYSGKCDGQGGNGNNGNGNEGGKSCEDLGDVSKGTPTEPLDSVIRSLFEDPKEAIGEHVDQTYEVGDTIDELENELVLVKGNLEYEDIEVDLSSGNTTILVEGDLIGNDIQVTDRKEGHYLQIYTNGSFASDGGKICVDFENDNSVNCGTDHSGTAIQLFGTSEMAIKFGTGQKPRFEGLIYAASTKDEWEHVGSDTGKCSSADQLCIQATPDLYGGVTVATADLQGGGSITVEYDPDIKDDHIGFHEELLPPQLTYLNVVEQEIVIKNN